MFGQQTRVDNDWIITNPQPMKYYISPLIEKDDIQYQNNTLHRSMAPIGSNSEISTSTSLRDSELTTIKGRHDLITDRLGPTTPHIRYGDPLDFLRPQESTSILRQCSQDPHSSIEDEDVCISGNCNRGQYSLGMTRLVHNVTFSTSNHVQQGFSNHVTDISKPIDTRLLEHDIVANEQAHYPSTRDIRESTLQLRVGV